MAGDASAPKIEHVIVLMLENRSYDHLLGFVDVGDGRIPGHDEDGNPLGCPVSSAPGARFVPSAPGVRYAAPLDPDHSHASAMLQLSDGNTGFVESYLAKADGTSPEARDRIAVRLRGAGIVTIGVAALQWLWPPAAAVWLGAAAVIGGTAWGLVWGGTSFSGYVPSALLEFVGKLAASKRVVVGGAVAGAVVLAVFNAIGGTPARVVDGLALLAAGGGLLFAAAKVGAHTTTPGDREVFERAIVNEMTPAAIEPLVRLAQGFATCTRWCCSVPGETWPNRNFVHAGTSDGAVDIEYRLFHNRTIFERLAEAGHEWAIYYRGVPQVLAFPNLWPHFGADGAARPIDELWSRLADPASTLPAYTFIEPFHGTEVPGTDFGAERPTDSQHSGNNRIAADCYDEDVAQRKRGVDFEAGMRLVANLYERLKQHPGFTRTLLVITYDEHGGYYDHRPPTNATPPGKPSLLQRLVGALLVGFGMREKSYDFKLLGPRVPTIIVNPRIVPHPVDTPFDHTSIPRTVRKIFGIGTELSRREDEANTFEDVATLDQDRTNLPDLSPWQMPADDAPAPAAQPSVADDAFTRSLDMAARGLFHYVDLAVEHRVPDRPARRKAMRRARREVRMNVGRRRAAGAAGDGGVTAGP